MGRTPSSDITFGRPSKRARTMAPAAKRKLSRLRLPELKYRDYSLLSSGTGNIEQLIVLQGDDGDDYTGSKLFMERIDTSCSFSSPESARLTVLMPKDPTSAPIFLDPTRRYDERQFTILYDEIIPSEGSNFLARRRISIKRMQEKISSISSVVIKGNLYVCWNFNSPQTSTANTRLYFTDN